MSSKFASLEEVVSDTVFPAVDLALRRGRHIDREDGDWYAFVTDAQDYLEPFYRRYGCELISQSDGYFYLLPTGEQLSKRHLSAGEMLVGQTLALQYLDPATIQSGGVVTREQVLARLGGLMGDRDLAKALEPRRKRFDDERIIHDSIRKGVTQAVRNLVTLGFIEILEQDRFRLRSPLLRFADPVRGLEDLGQALERLIARGEVLDPEAEEEGTEADDGRTDGLADENDAEDGEDSNDEVNE